MTGSCQGGGLFTEWVDVKDINWTTVRGVHAREEQSSELTLRASLFRPSAVSVS